MYIIKNTCKTFITVFVSIDTSKTISETWVMRQKLEDVYKKILLTDLEYALDKKVEQEL
jgi:protein SMG7